LDIAEGMHFIHEQGFTHRDLKSKNVLYYKDTMRAKVTDFGMARNMNPKQRRLMDLKRLSITELPKTLIQSTSNADATDTMTAMRGTPQWMAPELCAVEVAIMARQQAIPKPGSVSAEERARALEDFRAFQASHTEAEVSKKVDAIYNRDKKLQELERNLGNLEVWTTTEPSQALSMLRQEKAKRKYVAQHEHYLRDFTRVLAEVQRLESCINPPGLQDIPACNERLRRLEARSALAVGAAVRLHDHVAQVAEEYHKTMVALNDQLLRWDTLVSG